MPRDKNPFDGMLDPQDLVGKTITIGPDDSAMDVFRRMLVTHVVTNLPGRRVPWPHPSQALDRASQRWGAAGYIVGGKKT